MRNTLVLLGLAFVTSCVSTLSSDIKYPVKVSEDKDYYPAYQQASRSFEVVTNFKTQFHAHVTRISPELQSALQRRSTGIWNETQTMIPEAEKGPTFFVTLFTSNRELSNISDKNLWNIQLRAGEQQFKPQAVKSLNSKERWQPFFPEVNTWSSEYLIVFEASQAMLEQSLQLQLSSPDGSIRAEW